MERRHCPSTSRSRRRSGPGTSRPASGRAISVRDCAGPATGPDVRATIRSARSGLVADTANGHDDLRTLGVALDLGPQTLHMDIDEPGVRRVPVSPDLFPEIVKAETYVLEHDLADVISQSLGATEQTFSSKAQLRS